MDDMTTTDDKNTTSPAATLAQGTWALDDAHTSVGFSIRRLGLAKVRGHFREVTAELVVGPTVQDCRVTAAVALASIDTGNPERDAHLRSAELLDVERRPTMSYRSTGFRRDASGWNVDGELSIGDVTAPLALLATGGGVEDFFDGTRHAGFEATGEIHRKGFGLGFGAFGAMLGDVVNLDLDLEFVEPA